MSDKPEALRLADALLEVASVGYDEWRVQDPKDGSYCMAFSWPDVNRPEHDARAWLADQKHRFPEGRYANFVVACVRVVPKKDRMLAESAEMIQRLHAECEEWRKLRDPTTLHANLLRGIPARLDDATLWHMAGGDQKMGELRAECERLRADAERYRWLRATTNFATNRAGERIDVRNKPDLWDAAIDAARKEQA